MELHPYLNVLRKYWGIVVLLTVLGAGSAYWLAKRQPKIYQTTATLVINAGAPSSLIPYLSSAVGDTSNGGVSPVEALAASYAVLLQTRSFDAQVIQRLHLAATPDELGNAISSDLIPNTNYWTISVTWNDPVQAAAIANGIAHTFIQANAAAQAEAQSSVADSDIGQALTYFRNKIKVTQQRLDALLANPASNPAQVSTTEDQLSTLEDTYYKLLGTAGTSASTPTTTAALSDPAVVPHLPISPNVRKSVLFGLAGGLLVGLILAFLLDYLDYSLHTAEDLERLVGQAPLSVVGDIFATGRRPRRKLPGRGLAKMPSPTTSQDGTPGTLSVLNAQLVMLSQSKASISEAFRTLRTNLEFSSLDKPLKSLVITSSQPGEGKSTVAANLAIAVAQAGKQVILVDADLRRPSLSALMHVQSGAGFTTALLNRDREARARALDGGLLLRAMVPNLRVLTSGPRPPNPAELLASESMTAVLRDLEERADLVIFDTPAMGVLSDAVVLAARVSGTLLVARAGFTRRAAIPASMSALRKVGANVVGIVLNGADSAPAHKDAYLYDEESRGRRESQGAGEVVV
jgi:capsular exopolysaccharide synthesis family protein